MYTNGSFTKNCVNASRFILPEVRKGDPSASEYHFDIQKKGWSATHDIVLCENGNAVIDTQLRQFKNHLGLTEAFVRKGVYSAAEYWARIPDYRNELEKAFNSYAPQ
ncbi:MAG: hypothetical protein V1836_03805 [Candidatus Aenigmatarchaeota archaeon]